MNNSQYIDKIISSVDRILVDTSTLMEKGFQLFIINNRERILANGKQIIIPKAVCSELTRHLGSNDPVKESCVMAAISIISMNRDIFQVESAPLTDMEIAHDFADVHLLSDLTLHRTTSKQLLITNDRCLSIDAFELNQQQSCKGRKVLVCYVNSNGELQCCECVRLSLVKGQNEATPEIKVPPTPTISKPLAASSPKEQKLWEFDWKSGMASISCVGIIYGLYKGGKAFLRYINT